MFEFFIPATVTLLTLSDKDTFVNMRQATGEERAELDEVVDGDALFLSFARCRVLLLRLAVVLPWHIVTAGRFHLTLLVLIRQPI